jgi:ribosomal protein S18 acetylase RimI-like enzyme
MSVVIRQALEADHDAIWGILEPILRAGETYALPTDWQRPEALAYWLKPGNEVFVAEQGGRLVGTYYLHSNQQGGGAHVANCGFATAAYAQGRGLASQMCDHSLQQAAASGYLAMQFNFVISTNERAVRLWHRMGFKTVGLIPNAFKHPKMGFVDALVMHRML